MHKLLRPYARSARLFTAIPEMGVARGWLFEVYARNRFSSSIPFAKNNPGFDSFLITETAIYIFQMTVSRAYAADTGN